MGPLSPSRGPPIKRARPLAAARSGGATLSEALTDRIAACALCADRFARSATAHAPAPVVWFRPGARILIASQAPGLRAHRAGVPFADPSGVRLRAWLGMTEAEFYDRERVAILPAAFCFPGYDPKGADLPPPAVCARTWRAQALAEIGPPRLTALIGGYAQRLHLGPVGAVTATVRDWRRFAPAVFALPHPSWRNNGWLARNPWFEAETLPALRAAVRAALA